MRNGADSEELVYFKISRNGTEKLHNIQVELFCKYLRSIALPFRIFWKSQVKILFIVQAPSEFSEQFCEAFKQYLQNFSIKKMTKKDVNVFLNDNNIGNFIHDKHNCTKMSDAQNDESDIFKFLIKNELDGWHFEIEFYETDPVEIRIFYCPFCGKRLKDN